MLLGILQAISALYTYTSATTTHEDTYNQRMLRHLRRKGDMSSSYNNIEIRFLEELNTGLQITILPPLNRARTYDAVLPLRSDLASVLCFFLVLIVTNIHRLSVVGRLLLERSGVTLLPLLVKVIRYFLSVNHFPRLRFRYSY